MPGRSTAPKSSLAALVCLRLLAAPGLLTGCMTTGTGEPEPRPAPAAPAATENAGDSGQGAADPDDLTTQDGAAGNGIAVEEIDAAVEAVAEGKSFRELPIDGGEELEDKAAIPAETNADVEQWISYFTVRDRERFQRFLERGERYRSLIQAVLRDQGVPQELYYQAMIESGFSTHARSHANAVGVWQFIAPTGRRYGLRIDGYVDERRDPMRATVAAALYLRDLHNVFQSWYLAMAAYNAGEGRILGAIMRAKTRDFWDMVRKQALPKETMQYIPKFLAAMSIGEGKEKYGFEDLAPEVAPQLAGVVVPSPVRLADIARVADVPLELLKEANPHLLKEVTPPGVDTYRLWVPKDQADQVRGRTDRLAALRVKSLKPLAAAGTATRHRVGRGETLGVIAKKYGVSAQELRRANNLRSNNLKYGTVLRIPATGRGDRAMAVSRPSGTKLAGPAAAPHKYRVRRGDDLSVIARRFGLSVQELKRLNNLRRNTIYAGQTLKVSAKRG